MSLIEWWNSLGTAAQVFYCIANPSTLVLLIQTLLMFLGISGHSDIFGDTPDGMADIGDDIPDISDNDGIFGHDSVTETPDDFGLDGLRIFTIRGLIAFFVVFGWVGVVMQGANVGLFITLPVAALCGLAMMLAIAFIFRAVIGLRSDGNADNRNCVGTAGKVHLTIPASRSGEGKVHIMLQGSYVERNAVTDEEESIPTGSEVVVVGVSGQTDLIVKKK